MPKVMPKEVLFSGYAKLQTGITATDLERAIGIVIVVDIATETITNADCTLAALVARNHVAEILVGQSLKSGPEPVVGQIDRAYQGSAKKAIIAALRNSYDKYRNYKDNTRQ